MSEFLDHPLVRWLVTISVSALAGLGVYLVRRLLPPDRLQENNMFTAATYNVAGLVYGVFLAFMIVIVWQNFQAAQQIASNEVTDLAQLWRDAYVLPERDAIRGDLYNYTRSVVVDDWQSMGAGKGGDPRTTKIYHDLWLRCYSTQISNEDLNRKTFYEESLRNMNNLSRDRRLRLTAGDADLPPMMWGLLIFGGLGMIALALLQGTKHGWIQLAVTVFLAAMLTHAVMIVAALASPFSGDFKVQPTPYEQLLLTFDQERTK
jgi:hypothetical protein